MTDSRTQVIINYRATSTYALNVILGAIESHSSAVPFIRLTRQGDDLPSIVRESADAADTVVVLWSFFSPDFRAMATELSAVKARIRDPRVVHIVGGVHATAEPEQTLRAGFDVVAIGEGERTITELLQRLSTSRDLSGLRGVAFFDNGKYFSTGSAEPVDLNEFPPFAVKHRRFNPIEITRGCIYACRFCQTPFMFKARFRHRTIPNICQFVSTMKQQGLKDVRFITPTSLSYGSSDASVDIQSIEELLGSVRAIVGRDGRIFFGTFPSELRPEHVTPDVLAILRKYVDNDNLIIGGQSGSTEVLELSRRGHDVSCIIDAVRYSLEAGFLPNVDFIFGLPGETSSDLHASIRLAERLVEMGARVHGHTFMPLPGTPFRGAKPGVVPAWASRHLKRLESRGRLYGQWKQQVSIARCLASAADERGRHGKETIQTA